MGRAIAKAHKFLIENEMDQLKVIGRDGAASMAEIYWRCSLPEEFVKYPSSNQVISLYRVFQKSWALFDNEYLGN